MEHERTRREKIGLAIAAASLAVGVISAIVAIIAVVVSHQDATRGGAAPEVADTGTTLPTEIDTTVAPATTIVEITTTAAAVATPAADSVPSAVDQPSAATTAAPPVTATATTPAVTASPTTAPPPTTVAPAPTPTAAQPSTTWEEIAWGPPGETVPLFSAGPAANLDGSSGPAAVIAVGTMISVDCRRYDQEAAASNNGGWWYRIAGGQYAGFWTAASVYENGDGPWPNGEASVDLAVAVC